MVDETPPTPIPTAEIAALSDEDLEAFIALRSVIGTEFSEAVRIRAARRRAPDNSSGVG